MAYDATTGKLGFSRSAGSGEADFIWEKLTSTGIRSDERCDTDYRMNGTPEPLTKHRASNHPVTKNADHLMTLSGWR